MTAQIKIGITFSEAEREAVREAYASYIAGGGNSSLNIFLRKLIMEAIKNE